ncbi:MAG TPA: hypothetical protein VNM16_10145, partial [Bacillota bacterium]|nr:hypothetical protein [Bacillota bacterium]
MRWRSLARAAMAAVLALNLIATQAVWAGPGTSVSQTSFQSMGGNDYAVSFTTSASGTLSAGDVITLAFSNITVTGATYGVATVSGANPPVPVQVS